MKDQNAYIERLIDIIEQKLNWGSGQVWTGHEFEALSEKILEETGKTLSVTTLKRVWGKAKLESSLSKSTLDILAEFAGFTNWRVFSKQKTSKLVINNPLKNRSVIWFGIIGLALFLLASYYFLIPSFPSSLSAKQIENISFEPEISIGQLPATVKFEYNLSDLNPANFVIAQAKNGNEIPLSQQQGTIAATYYYPGYFNSQLKHRKQVISEQVVRIPTDGWKALLNRSSLLFPIYLSDEQIFSDTILAINQDKLSDIENNSDYINISFNYINETPGIDDRNFALSYEFQMPKALNNSPCNVSSVIIHGLEETISFGFCIPGCVGDLNFNFSGERISGSQIDLSAFGRATKSWTKIKVVNQENNLKIIADSEVILSHTLKQSPGLIGGLSFIFDGFGEVRKVKLNDIQQELELL
jgi:hypothetical protein